MARCQRHYQILSYRYIQQFTQRDVANRLGISPRHLEREQNVAIQALAAQLRERYEIHERLEPTHFEGSPIADLNGAADIDREMLWLGDSLAAHEAEVGSITREAMRLAESLARKHQVILDHSSDTPLPSVAVARTVLKQILLNLITTAIHCVPGGRVSLDVRAEQGQIVIRATTTASAQGTCHQPERDGLDMISRLVELFKGSLHTSLNEGPLAATVILPTVERIPVLAIEDNGDTLRLWERYVQDTRFCLMGVRDPDQALRIAVETQPRLIILDVMMPGVDGWDLLAQLRNHPSTSAIPIVVCTVLPQEELALSLGASDFLRKPATRQEFQAVLERQSVVAAPG